MKVAVRKLKQVNRRLYHQASLVMPVCARGVMDIGLFEKPQVLPFWFGWKIRMVGIAKQADRYTEEINFARPITSLKQEKYSSTPSTNSGQVLWRRYFSNFNFAKQFAAAVLVFGLLLQGGGLAALKTLAYFSDSASLTGNTFTAGTLSFNLNPSANFASSPLGQGGTASYSTVLVNDGSLGFQYKVKADNLSGGLCGILTLEAKLATTTVYSGLLADFTATSTFDSLAADWHFTVTLPGGTADSLQGEVCDFNIVYSGWQTNLPEGGGGFTNVEKIGSVIKAAYWSPSVVLNEFLPHSGNYQEFIELYNKASSSIDLSKYYIKADSNVIPINTTTTGVYSGGLTTIPANGWLTVTTGGNVMNDSSGTVALYNGNDVLVDSYSYGSPVHDVNNTPNQTNNLAGYWPFDGGTQDFSGNANTGTNNGATFAAGKINQALSFDGTNNYVEVADSATLEPSSVTLEAWVKGSSPGSYKYIASKFYNSDRASYALYTSSSGGLRFYIGYAGGYVLSPDAGTGIWDNNWHHVVGTYDGLNVRLYEDGTEIGSGTPTTVNIVYNTDNFYVGRSYGSGYYFHGIIDEVKIYNRALTDTEVFEHYKDVSTPSGTVPADKSYARIPDGTGAWVDPVPTPDEPNTVDPNKVAAELCGTSAAEDAAMCVTGPPKTDAQNQEQVQATGTDSSVLDDSSGDPDQQSTTTSTSTLISVLPQGGGSNVSDAAAPELTGPDKQILPPDGSEPAKEETGNVQPLQDPPVLDPQPEATNNEPPKEQAIKEDQPPAILPDADQAPAVEPSAPTPPPPPSDPPPAPDPAPTAADGSN